MKSLLESQTPPSSAKSRLAVLWVLYQVINKGQSLNTLLPILKKQQNSQDYGFCAELANGVCRQYFLLEGLIQPLLTKKMKKKDLDIQLLIYLGVYQLEYMQVAAHAALSETVGLTRDLSKSWATKLVNALLRRYQRERDLLWSKLKQDSAQWSLPDWILKKIQQQWQADWQQIALAYQQKPPMILRLDTKQIKRTDFIQQLTEKAIPSPLVASGVELTNPLAVSQLSYFSQGGCSVQDAGAQLAGTLLDPQDNDIILDACAAPGGKSLHLLQLAQNIQLTAIDNNAHRLIKIKENIVRANLSADIIQGDASNPQGAWAEKQYHRILLDVPCSASGVIRRHPDIKLLRKSTDLKQLTELQAKILSKIWGLLKEGGTLLYVTCSLFEEENEHQIALFLQQQNNAQALEINEKWGIKKQYGRQLLPITKHHDGFYFMLLKKTIQK